MLRRYFISNWKFELITAARTKKFEEPQRAQCAHEAFAQMRYQCNTAKTFFPVLLLILPRPINVLIVAANTPMRVLLLVLSPPNGPISLILSAFLISKISWNLITEILINNTNNEIKAVRLSERMIEGEESGTQNN